MTIRKFTTKASSWLCWTESNSPSSQMFCLADMHIYEYVHIYYATTYFPRTWSKNVNLWAPQWGWLVLLSPDIYPALLRAMNSLSASKIWLMKSAADFPFYFRMTISYGCYSMYWIYTDGIDSKGMRNSTFWNNTLVKYCCTRTSDKNLLLAGIPQSCSFTVLSSANT